MQLVLSIFSGVGLLDRAFRENGFCVVSAGDLIIGQNICDFTGVKNKFDGLIGGPPCQEYSRANRNRPNPFDCYGYEMLKEFERVLKECDCTWALLENVPNVPDLIIDGYEHQRFDINQAWFEDVVRLRHIQFYRKIGSDITPVQVLYSVTHRGKKTSGALASDNRTFKELVRLQGLESDYDLTSFNVQGKKRAVGNGVPLSVGRYLAKCVLDVTDPGQKINVTLQRDLSCDSPVINYCKCGCGRNVTLQRKKYYSDACRKRASRKRLQYD